MKKLIFLLCVISLVACTNDDDEDVTPTNTNNTTTIQSQIQSNVQEGIWRISLFSEDGQDETNNFSGYSFTFNTNGSLLASNQTNNYNGTWSVSDSNPSDDSISDIDFNILFNLTNNFQDLNDDWDVISHSSSKIELRDISGGNGGTDLLTFEKN